MIFRRKFGIEYSLIRGSTIDIEERIESAVICEVKKEIILDVKVKKLLFENFDRTNYYRKYYLCKPIDDIHNIKFISEEPEYNESNNYFKK